MRKIVALYAGSFDPPTFGHLDLIQRAVRIFDKLVVAVAYNDEKQALFSAEERMDMLREVTAGIPNVEVTTFTGLTVEFAKQNSISVLVRGLRVMSDFELELTMAVTNQKLHNDIDTVCLMPSEQHLLLSSRLVRQIALFGGDLTKFVPAAVENRLRRKLA